MFAHKLVCESTFFLVFAKKLVFELMFLVFARKLAFDLLVSLNMFAKKLVIELACFYCSTKLHDIKVKLIEPTCREPICLTTSRCFGSVYVEKEFQFISHSHRIKPWPRDRRSHCAAVSS